MRTCTPLMLATLLAISCAGPQGERTSTDLGESNPGGRFELLDVPDAEGAEPLLPVEVDRGGGKVQLLLPPPDDDGVHGEFLLVAGIETGLGANDVGLDRGQMRGARWVRFRRVGQRILLEEMNSAFRAEAGGALERGAVAQSFATSVLWGGEPGAIRSDGQVPLDITDLVVRDAHGIASTLSSTGEGGYALDASCSGLDATRCRAFPDNLEFVSVLTFRSANPGDQARRTAPDGGALTFVQRQGLLRLPDAGYERRRFDPRMGAFSISYLDYGVPLDAPLAQRFAVRHRLRFDPATGKPEPIVYYVDRAAPEPVRSALVEGASWWAEAFADAGYPGLFRVEVAPEGLDPLDTRFNVIQWVHRSTRGWSYGNAISDPRTGEILKGHVSLGSLRVRQDRRLFEGLLGTAKTGTGDADDPVQLSLARIRQLSAHEVGHTLGLAHNFAASTSDRASVMDYPAPRVRPMGESELDVSSAYDVGIGEWDKHSIEMLYGEPPAGESVEAFHGRLHRAARARGLVYLTDADARSAGAAQPYANLWDDGVDPADALTMSLEVRRRAMERFGKQNLAEGRPLAELEEVFVPVYLHHRYQVDAAIKAIGGVVYEHEVNGADAKGGIPVDAQLQRRAFDALFESIRPGALVVPDSVARLLGPRPPGYSSSRETFDRSAGAAFDRLAAADVAARMVVRGLFHPERLHRVELQKEQGPVWGLEGGAASFVEACIARAAVRPGAALDQPSLDAVAAVVHRVFLEEAMRTYGDARTSRVVREALHDVLSLVSVGGLEASEGEPSAVDQVRAEIRAMLDRPAMTTDRAPTSSAPDAPPGSPIGGARGPSWERASLGAFPGLDMACGCGPR